MGAWVAVEELRAPHINQLRLGLERLAPTPGFRIARAIDQGVEPLSLCRIHAPDRLVGGQVGDETLHLGVGGGDFSLLLEAVYASGDDAEDHGDDQQDDHHFEQGECVGGGGGAVWGRFQGFLPAPQFPHL